jgi:putative tryptophan/tyrosine transport system ATP-binding protein
VDAVAIADDAKAGGSGQIAPGGGAIAVLSLNNITRRFFPGTPNEVVAIDDLSLQVQAGDFVTIIGSNGAGKSTLLKIICGAVQVDDGSVELDGKDVTWQPEHARAAVIGRVDQDPMASTASLLSLEQNLSMAKLRGRPRLLSRGVTNQRRVQCREALEVVGLGLEERLKVQVGTLSGGQRQALALVMATIACPRVLLLDEHIAALDPQTARTVMEVTNAIVTRDRLTTLMVTHSMELAIRWGQRLIMMHRGRVVMDISGDEKSRLTVPGLVERFSKASGRAFDSDRALLV